MDDATVNFVDEVLLIIEVLVARIKEIPAGAERT
jgi:hypothetical protein